MKFEKPVAEVQKFDLKDVISASGESPINNPQTGTIVGEDTGSCAGDKSDNYNFDNCL